MQFALIHNNILYKILKEYLKLLWNKQKAWDGCRLSSSLSHPFNTMHSAYVKMDEAEDKLGAMIQHTGN